MKKYFVSPCVLSKYKLFQINKNTKSARIFSSYFFALFDTIIFFNILNVCNKNKKIQLQKCVYSKKKKNESHIFVTLSFNFL